MLFLSLLSGLFTIAIFFCLLYNNVELNENADICDIQHQFNSKIK